MDTAAKEIWVAEKRGLLAHIEWPNSVVDEQTSILISVYREQFDAALHQKRWSACDEWIAKSQKLMGTEAFMQTGIMLEMLAYRREDGR